MYFTQSNFVASKFVTVPPIAKRKIEIRLALFGAGDGSQVHLAYADGTVEEKSLLLHLAGSYLLNSISLLMMATVLSEISVGK